MQRIMQHANLNWHSSFDNAQSKQNIRDLELGHVLYFPSVSFTVNRTEENLLTPNIISGSSKNISYDFNKQKLAAYTGSDQDAIQKFMHRFAEQAKTFVETLLGDYQSHLTIGRTSYRPVEIKGRIPKSSRKDDTRLHVDSFPSTPMHNKRILRLFTNINPHDQPRVWRLGEKFKNVVERFLPQIKKPLPLSRHLMHLVGATRQYRSLYDHYMLNLHNTMKADNHYQQTANQETFHFSSSSTWLVFTDCVSHAAMAGQYLLEQTFYLPVNAMQDPALSPLHILENYLQKKLIQM